MPQKKLRNVNSLLIITGPTCNLYAGNCIYDSIKIS
jgi:hypothetical protein